MSGVELIADLHEVAAGAVFLPRQKDAATCAKRLLVTSLASHGLVVTDWREVPVDDVSEKAENCLPNIFDVVVTRHSQMSAEEFERRLGAARREAERRAAAYRLEDFSIASLGRVSAR